MTNLAGAVLDGTSVAVDGGCLAAEICARRLRRLGARTDGAGGMGETLSGVVTLNPTGSAPGRGPCPCTAQLSALGAQSVEAASEATVQAISGLMAVHGRDAGRPRRIGLDVVSVATGILATQGILAAYFAHLQDHCADVEVSAISGALFFLSHYLPVATSGVTADDATMASATPGPPFPTADGHWVEIETLDPQCWLTFWRGLGAPDQLIGAAWHRFWPRYQTARCSLPDDLPRLTERHTVEQLAGVAHDSGVSLCRVRDYDELLTDPHSADAPWALLAPTRPRPRRSAWRSASGEGPLGGVRVVEITTRVQGPLASRLLQMLGADVTRVEPPGGDVTRGLPPGVNGRGIIFSAFNSGKQSVELNLKTPHGRRAALELVSDADVLLHNWRPGRDAELGLSYDTCSRVQPDLVYVHASGWGNDGGECQLLGTDYLVQAHAALGAGINGYPSPPFPSRVIFADLLGALVACEGALAGLVRRERQRGGCRVTTSLLSGVLSAQQHVLDDIRDGHERRRLRGRPLLTVIDEPVATEEGFLMVDPQNEDQTRRLVKIVAVPGGRSGGQGATRLRDGSAREWETKLLGAGIACGVAHHELAAAAKDRRLAPFVGPLDGLRDLIAPGAPWRFSPRTGR